MGRDHVGSHTKFGIASLPLFLGVDTHLDFREAMARGKAVLEQPPVTNVTTVLMHHDSQRLSAAKEHHEAFVASGVAFNQGLIFLLTVVVSLVLARGARISTHDVLRWRVAKAEVGAVACTATNVGLVLLLGSLGPKALASVEVLWGIIFAIVALIIVQLGCLWKTCRDIVKGKHEHASTRAPRLSTVVPQAAVRVQSGTIEGGEGQVPTGPSGDWKSAMQEQDKKHQRAMQERGEKYERAMQEQDKKHQQAMQEQDKKHERALKKQKQELDELRGMLEDTQQAVESALSSSGKGPPQAVRSSAVSHATL